MACWAGVRSAVWRKVPAGPVKVPRVSWAELVGDLVPGGAGGGLGDADEQQGEPAQDDVGADPLFQPVVDRAQVDDLLHVSPAAFDFQELPVAQGDVGGGQLRVGGAEQVLAVEVLLGLDGRGVDAQQPAGGDAQVAVQARAWWR